MEIETTYEIQIQNPKGEWSRWGWITPEQAVIVNDYTHALRAAREATGAPVRLVKVQRLEAPLATLDAAGDPVRLV